MIAFENVQFSYEDGNWVLKDLNFEVKEGEFVSIIGSNGSGKSTIARLSSGLLVSQNGKVSVDGNSFNDPIAARAAREKVGIVFQNPDNQFIGMTVEEDMAFGLENFNIAREEAHLRVEEISKALKIDKFLSFPPSMLSGGEKQKVAIAGALVLSPKYLILDEITSLLDPQSSVDILANVKSLVQERGIGVLYVTHKPEEALTSDKIIVISNGTVVLTGSPLEVFRNVSLLEGIGVSVPGAVSVSYRLKEAGLLKSIYFDSTEILRKLC
jgi:energy-coupling factor transport system ATP-binding protein